MSAPTLTALEKHDRMNREAALVILRDPCSIPLQVTWARAFLRRIGDDSDRSKSAQAVLAFDEVTR